MRNNSSFLAFCALTLATVSLARDGKQADAKAAKDGNETVPPMRVVSLREPAMEMTGSTRHFKIMYLPSIKPSRCSSLDTGLKVPDGGNALLYVDDSRKTVSWSMATDGQAALTIQVCNQDKQELPAAPWPVMLFIQR
jgi:hypothetical protein